MAFLFATLLSALLTWAAFPPWNLGFLVFVAPAPFLWALRRVGLSRQALGLGIMYGAITFGLLLYWIAVLGVVAWLPLTIGFAGYSGLYAVVVWWARTMRPWQWWLITVGGWALLEFLRSRVPFGGFPWGSLGYAVGSMAWPRGASQWIGASGWSVVVAAFAAGVALLLDRQRATAFVVGPAVAIVLLTAAGAVLGPEVGGPAFRVAIVQGNSPCPRVHCDSEKSVMYAKHLELTRAIPNGAVDLVVWGENALGGEFEPVGNPEIAVELAAEAKRIGAYLLVSGTRGAGPEHFVNSNLLFAPDGEFIGEYLKRHPVPFGEYVPFREYLEFIPQLEQVPRDMVRGEAEGIFTVAMATDRAELVEFRLGTVISFEGAFARKARSTVRAGAQMLTVNTNEASFGTTPASDQLIGITRVSAAENGVQVIHAAVTGKSTFISASGSVGETTDLFTEEILVGTVRWSTGGQTLYTRYGDWLQVLAMVVVVVPAAMWRPRRGRDDDSLFGPPPPRTLVRR